MKINLIALAFLVLLTTTGSACAQSTREQAKTSASGSDCAPLETREPNASKQRPAFAGQTRVCGVKSGAAFDVTVLAKGLERPWAVEPLPGGDLLITEKTGRLRVGQGGVSAASGQGGLPPVDARGQGGLLDVALSPDFARDRTIYWSFTEPREGGNGTSVARGVLTEDRRNLEQVRVIFRAMPTYNNGLHFGSRLAFGPDGKLNITLGERFDKAVTRPQAQQLGSHLGKIIRINPDGSVPDDNPFVKQPGALPEIWDI